jgi:hypothetical protein
VPQRRVSHRQPSADGSRRRSERPPQNS